LTEDIIILFRYLFWWNSHSYNYIHRWLLLAPKFLFL